MGFSSDRKELMEPRKKKPVDEGPSLYKGENGYPLHARTGDLP